jgi:hypothetical protein
MPRILSAPLCCATLLLPLPVQAGVHWLCNLSQDLTRIVCVADPDVDQAADSRADRQLPAPATATVRGTRFPLDARHVYTVDLWSPATEPDRLELLARATMCYRSPGCVVTFSAPALAAATTPTRMSSVGVSP